MREIESMIARSRALRSFSIGVVLLAAGISTTLAQTAYLLNGTYAVSEAYYNNLLTIAFDGAGNYSGTAQYNNAGTACSVPISGAYTVDANNKITLSYLIFQPGGACGSTYLSQTASGILSGDAGVLSLIDIVPTQLQDTLLGVRRIPAPTIPYQDNYVSGLMALQSNTTGVGNTAAGFYALRSNTTGGGNTALGQNALSANTTGDMSTALGYNALIVSTGAFNTAVGGKSLESNTTGNRNTGTGYETFYNSSTGSDNTADGFVALSQNTTGSRNNAMGTWSLANNTSANDNNAVGAYSLYSNNTGAQNTAFGSYALYSNTTGNNLNGTGAFALFSNTTGHDLNAMGLNSLYNNTTGYGNTAVGSNALYFNTTGFRNVAIGNNAGQNVISGSYNNYIGWNVGVAYADDETGVTRIGNPTYATAIYVAGIASSPVTGATVVVTPSGRLGVLASSERYKTAITSLTNEPEKLQRLRPVTFHLKSEPQGSLQYGLIAEEVENIYPDLVIRSEDGRIQGVRYDELAPILLSEVQHQRTEIAELRQQVLKMIDLLQQGAKVAELERQVAEMRNANKSM
jgi:trimeric autotransporter adhesin